MDICRWYVKLQITYGVVFLFFSILFNIVSLVSKSRFFLETPMLIREKINFVDFSQSMASTVHKGPMLVP